MNCVNLIDQIYRHTTNINIKLKHTRKVLFITISDNKNIKTHTSIIAIKFNKYFYCTCFELTIRLHKNRGLRLS